MTDNENDATFAVDAITDFPDLYPRQQTIFTWTVLSLKEDDENTAYKVNTKDLTCTCPDHEYNREDGEVCKHLASALYESSGKMRVGEALNKELHEQVMEIRQAAEAIERRSAGVAADTAHDATAGDETDTSSDGVDAAGAADRLKSAFDEHLSDMQVQHHAGKVWFQTGQDTEDDWPYPGQDSTFEVITGPDSVEYVHDGSAEWADSEHEWFDEKPGEWWKNAIRPEDVDGYIEEVLG